MILSSDTRKNVANLRVELTYGKIRMKNRVGIFSRKVELFIAGFGIM